MQRPQGWAVRGGAGPGQPAQRGVGEIASLPGLGRGWEWSWGEQFWSQSKVHKNKTR